MTKNAKQNQVFIVVVCITGECAIIMERKVEDLLSRQNLLFAKNPFEKIYKQKLNITRKEMRLRMEPPINCSVIKASLNQNFPQSDISKLKLEPPTAKKAFIKAEDEEIHKISPPAEKFILKITETEGEIYKVHPPVEKVIPKTLEISKKEWANRDFIKLENWFIIHVSNSKNIAIVGYRPDIEEVNKIIVLTIYLLSI